MEILIILLTLSFINICVVAKCITNLNKRITELEKEIDTKIDTLQYQIDDVLCDINNVNENVLNTYGSLSSMKDEIRTIKLNDYERKSKFGRNTKRLSPRH